LPPSSPSKLFFVDDGPTKKSAIEHDIDVGPPEDQSDPPTSEDEEQSEEEDSSSSIPDEPHDEAKTSNTTPPPSAPHPRLPKSRKALAWTDPDDASLEVSLASSARLRKLRDAPDEDAVDGREYERRLRRQFVKMNPTPGWATAARKKRRRAESEGGADADGDTDADVSTLDLDALVTSSGGILDRKRRARLEPGVLSIERLRDANQAAQAEGEVTASRFHPSPQVSMLLVASSDRRIRLFNVRVQFGFFFFRPPSLPCACRRRARLSPRLALN
jgi:U3 small nucleolar RNA-associated protein 18